MRAFLIAMVLGLASCGGGIPALALSPPRDGLEGIDNGRPLVIESSPGGNPDLFRLKGLDLLFHHVPIIVDGYCASACTLLIDVARANVCLTTEAVLAYHEAYDEDATGKAVKYFRPSYETPGLQAYLDSRGGVPANKDDVMLVPFNQAKAFYKPCPGAE